MDNLSDLYQAIDRLNRDEFRQLRAYVDQHVEPPQIADEDVQTKIAEIHKAFAEIREGMTQEELDEMIAAMNSEYIEPIDPADYDWLDEKDAR